MLDELLKKTVPPVHREREGATKGARTRERILDVAQDSVIHKGFAATSIEELVEAAGITKSGFFYHFRDKHDLATQLLERFAGEDAAIFERMSARARSLSDDPLTSFLIFIKLFAEMFDDLPDVHPGCLVAAITYQDRMFDREVHRRNKDLVLEWRRRFQSWIEEIAAVHPPRVPVDPATLADHFSVLADGGIILSRAMRDQALIGRQLRLFHDLVRLLFSRA